MSLRNHSFLAFAAVALMSASGCELIAKVDRDKIPHESSGGAGGSATTSSSGTGGMGGSTSSSSSGTGGMGGSTSSSGTGGMGTGGMGTGGMGTGGTGGMGQCATEADCPPPANACITATCTNGVCGTTFVAAGTVTSDSMVGDCHHDECDGNGAINSVVDDADLPDDTNPCTKDTCDNGTPAHDPEDSGTVCGTDLICDGNGNCVGCTQPSDCPGTDTECQTRTCTTGMCGFDFAPAGTLLTTQTTGDCKQSQCDGNGAIEDVADDNDLPVDDKECTDDVCDNGTASNPKHSAGAACTQNGGSKCDGNGDCVQCLLATDCGTDTACQKYTCTAGVCGTNNMAAGTVVANPTAGDCHTDQCDGNGGLTNDAVDDSDKPTDDGMQCTLETCSNGTVGHPAAPKDTSCSQGGGSKCDGNGACVQCFQASDCGADTACKTFACNAGACQQNNVTAGTVVANPTAGDCHIDQCDGSGGIVSSVDDSDKPIDNKQCTEDVCLNGTASNPAASVGTMCTENGGTKCDGNGACVQCFQASDCGTDTACQKFTCNAGVCGTNNMAAGTVVANPSAGDCHTDQCDGNGNITNDAVDDSDKPADDGMQCTLETCTNGTADHPAAPQGTTCNQGGGSTCDGSGNCVTCLQDSDCPAGANACQVAVCNSGTCGFAAATAGDLPAGMQTAGDCQKLVCDGVSQAPVSNADDTDVPADDGEQCTNDTCDNGAPAHPPAGAGTACSENGGTTCDGAGNCVAALSVSSTTPSDGGTAAASTTIAITFSEAMNTTTLTGQTSLGACTGSVQVSANDFASCIAFSSAAPAMNGAKTIATFTAQPGLLINRTYKVRVTTAAQSSTGVALPAQYTSTTGFTTTNPLASDTGVVISQVYGGGGNSGAYYKNDFVELHNRGTTAVDLTGWSVQTASANGSSWTVTNLSGSIAPGGYYLVWEAAGSSSTAVGLPAADATGPSTMGGSSGQVALLNTTTKLTVACPTGASVIDLVAYGGSTSCAGVTVTPNLSNTTSAARSVGGCTDTNDSAKDFTVGTVAAGAVNMPRNSASPAFTCTPAQNESGDMLEADYCATQFPLSLSVTEGTMQTVYGRIYHLGVTDQGMNPPSGVTAQLGYGPTTANPEYESGWTWVDATHNASCVDANPGSGETLCGEEDEFQATFATPAAGTYRYGYRVSLDGGATWTYCDNRQGDMGAGANSGLAFDLEDLASFTSTP